MRRRYGAWIRYGDPVSPDQVQFAAEHYACAILQPWEVDVAAHLKKLRPDMPVLAYKCLSSTRRYEPGPCYSSGLSWTEAEQLGEHLFAHRLNGARIEWSSYSGHWQMAVWRPEYRERWIANVVTEIRDSVFDGVMADNDVFDDYYGLDLPFAEGCDLAGLRAALDELVVGAGQALNAAGKILVPNIAESRREPGRWQRHAAFGGGYEEVWLAWAPDRHLDTPDLLAQTDCLRGPGLTVVRTASDGTDTHPNVLFGLAMFWIFGAGRPGTSFAATGHDQYNGVPHVAEQCWDLGSPASEPQQKGHARHRAFTGGWAAAHVGRPGGRPVTVAVPPGLVTDTGGTAPAKIRLAPRHGVLFRRPPVRPGCG